MSLKAELPLTQANSVSSWREEQVTTWLRKNNFGQYEQIFAENDVTGDVLLELDHQLLKELSISSVGQRVRLIAAVKHLRKSCMQEVRQSTLETQPRTASLPPRAESGEKLNRSHVHYSLPLDADRSSGAASLPYPFSEQSPSYTTAAPPNLIRHISSDSIPLGSIKQQCIRVVGEDGQFRVVNIDKALTAKGIFEKVLRKFNIKADGDKFGLFVVASDTGTARCLTDEEIVQICLSPGRPEKERLVLRKRHQPVNHDDFKRKDTIRHKFRKLENFFGEKPPRSSSQTKLGKFFGERPPSELISSNLSEYFPDHASGYLRSRFDKRRSRQGTSDKGRMERTAEIDEEEDISGDDPSDSDEGVFNKDQKGPEEEEEEERKKEDEEDEEEEEGPPSSSTETARPKGLKWIKGALIGMGSYGNVYLGLNSLSGELMAVKQVELPTGEGANEERKRFMLDALQREIGLLKDLNHVNIVRYLGSQSDEKHLNIFLEYVPGGSVVALLANYGPFEETMVRSFVKQILAGLCYLHQQDIIHRDIKGGNILVDNKGGVKISDFGISKKVEESIMRMSTPAGAHRASLQGSIFWMAPEVVKQTHYTQKADIWSLGCLIVEMFTGEHPFPESTQMQAIFKIGQYARPHIPENVSEEATSFLEKTFDLNFQERPTAAELQRHPFVTNIEIDT